MKVLLTGESGMLANAIVELNKIEKDFTLIDTSSLSRFENQYHFIDGKRVKDSEWNILDDENYKILDKIVDYNTIIVHTAAYVNTDKCENFPYEATKSNVLGTQKLVELARRTQCVFINFSTTAVFDPTEYMKNYGKFDETCAIDPKTIYGLTKYNAEIAVKQSLRRYVTVKPVFIYGDAPFDNSSNIRKILEHVYLQKKSMISITLDDTYCKNYMRSEYFALMFRQILLNYNACNFRDFIIARNQEYCKPWIEYQDTIANVCDIQLNTLRRVIDHKPEADYLQTHNGYSKNFYDLFPNFKLPIEASDDSLGIQKTFNSIKKLYGN